MKCNNCGFNNADDVISCKNCGIKIADEKQENSINTVKNAINKAFKGIALILFGILLCIGGPDINSTVLRSFSDFPFSLTGVILGVSGLIIIFKKSTKEKDE